jgi:hypothetical protein
MMAEQMMRLWLTGITTMNCAIASDSSNGSPALGASSPADGSAGVAGVTTLRSED